MMEGHELGRLTRVNLGRTPISGRTVYGTTARCECGAKFRTNEGPPSRRGVEKNIERRHQNHIRKILESQEDGS